MQKLNAEVAAVTQATAARKTATTAYETATTAYQTATTAYQTATTAYQTATTAYQTATALHSVAATAFIAASKNATETKLQAAKDEMNATETKLQAAKDEMNAAKEDMKAAKEEINATEAKVLAAKEEMNATEAKVQAAEAALLSDLAIMRAAAKSGVVVAGHESLIHLFPHSRSFAHLQGVVLHADLSPSKKEAHVATAFACGNGALRLLREQNEAVNVHQLLNDVLAVCGLNGDSKATADALQKIYGGVLRRHEGLAPGLHLFLLGAIHVLSKRCLHPLSTDLSEATQRYRNSWLLTHAIDGVELEASLTDVLSSASSSGLFGDTFRVDARRVADDRVGNLFAAEHMRSTKPTADKTSDEQRLVLFAVAALRNTSPTRYVFTAKVVDFRVAITLTISLFHEVLLSIPVVELDMRTPICRSTASSATSATSSRWPPSSKAARSGSGCSSWARTVSAGAGAATATTTAAAAATKTTTARAARKSACACSRTARLRLSRVVRAWRTRRQRGRRRPSRAR